MIPTSKLSSRSTVMRLAQRGSSSAVLIGLTCLTACSSGIVVRSTSPTIEEDPLQVLRDVHLDFMDDEGLVDYDGLRRRPRLLKRYLGAVAGGPDGEGPAVAKAFWIDVHNALVLRATSLYAPLDSLDECPAVFRRIRVRIGEEELSADEILSHKLRPLGDPRVLFALRMGSRGCPTPTRVFEPAGIERELQLQMLEELGRSRTVRVSAGDEHVEFARWMERYADWFGEEGARGYLADVLETARPTLARALRSRDTVVTFLPHDSRLDARL
ncbi:MAG: DUF547 domain-containing protein [Planctomycetes bacterium]|nr:DUF547 domain-containing protein [Planctomycetota bacterium]